MKKETDILVIGAGPVGLFTVFEAGLLGLKCTLIDNLDKVGGQCSELYPEKPIYDIPGVPNQTAQEHVDALMEQIKPFDFDLHLSQRVELIEVHSIEDGITTWLVKTNEGIECITKNIFIAAGAGSFEPRRPPNIEDPDKFLGNGVSYAVKSKDLYKDKNLFIFGGGDSALDWTVELAKIAKSVNLIHRRDQFRGAQHTEAQMRELVQSGEVNLMTPFQIDEIIGEDKVTGVSISVGDQHIDSNIRVHLVDKFGELGIWYRVCSVAFIGGTFDETQGHNPWEAIHLNRPVLHGPNINNFKLDYVQLDAGGLSHLIFNSDDLAAYVELTCNQTSAQQESESFNPLVTDLEKLATDLLALMDGDRVDN